MHSNTLSSHRSRSSRCAGPRRRSPGSARAPRRHRRMAVRAAACASGPREASAPSASSPLIEEGVLYLAGRRAPYVGPRAGPAGRHDRPRRPRRPGVLGRRTTTPARPCTCTSWPWRAPWAGRGLGDALLDWAGLHGVRRRAGAGSGSTAPRTTRGCRTTTGGSASPRAHGRSAAPRLGRPLPAPGGGRAMHGVPRPHLAELISA